MSKKIDQKTKKIEETLWQSCESNIILLGIFNDTAPTRNIFQKEDIFHCVEILHFHIFFFPILNKFFFALFKLIGRVYEYFLGKFALKESSGKGKGEFYTPKTIVNLIAELIEPYKGIIYDPCCIIRQCTL
jgi:type I restriction-modification system DNA methylase subunit